MSRWILAVMVWMVACPLWAFNKTQTRLILSEKTARPGETVWAGLEMKMPPSWHTYWRNGGDAGIPTSIEWNLPKGVTAGEIQWPIPHKLVEKFSEETTLVTYIHTNIVVLLVPLKIDASAPAGPLQISGHAEWQECADICVIGKNDLQATLTIGNADEKSPDADLIAHWQKRLPADSSSAPISAVWEITTNKDARAVVITWKTNAAPADFYPLADTNFDVGGVTEDLHAADFVKLRKVVKKTGDAPWPSHLVGLMVGKAESPDAFGERVEIPIAASAESTGGAAKSAVPPQSLALMLTFALLGGLLLNVMPCVLPVIALKVLGFVNQSKEHPQRVRQLGLVYGLGVLVSFFALAILAIGVQRAGGVANWGDAIRNPQFQVIITVLITLVALNLFGVFEITLGSGAMGAATGLASRHGFVGAFFNGVLATALATPCTAPFLGAALAFAFTQPPLVTILVFLAAGIGLALPFVLICMQPKLMQFLPKPGAWMERFKVAMGFPIIATAVWLLWVSSRTEDDMLWLGIFLVVVATAAWVYGEFFQRGARHRGLAAGSAVALLLAGYFGILEGPLDWRRPMGAANAAIHWQTWSPGAVEAARREGHPVLVDFTAKSCLSCKVNKITSIEIDATREKLKQIGAVAFEADYTYTGQPEIAAELQQFDRAGVPLVLVYPKDPNKPPEVLPTLLSPSIVLNALTQAAN